MQRPAHKVDKEQLQGGELLLPRSSWAPLSAIQGNDLTMFQSPTIAAAFDRVLSTWRPRSPIMLTSLCTATRPYTASRKWWAYSALFGRDVDLIVCSNGGIVPLPYEREYPFLNYDAKGQSQYDAEYIKVVGARLAEFIRTMRYKHVIFAFLQGMRNRVIAERLGPQLVADGTIDSFAILPSDAARQQARDEGAYMAPGFRMYPDLWPCVIEELAAHVRSVCLDYGVAPHRVTLPPNLLKHHSRLSRPKGFFE